MKDQLEEARGVTVSEDVQQVLAGVTQVLEYYKLGSTQIRVYLQLAKNGPMKATDVARNLGVHRTAAHQTLHELESLGLASKTLTWPSLYTALSFRDAVGLLWRERQRTLDSVQLIQNTLAAAFDRTPRQAAKKTESFTFRHYAPTDHPNSIFRSKLERLDGTSQRRLYYLEDPAYRHLANLIGAEAAANTGHPELGSFAIFDDSVFLFMRDAVEEWTALELRMPEIVAAYAALYGLLEGDDEAQ